MKKGKKQNQKGTIIISIILGLLILLNVYAIIKINALPMKYLLIFYTVCAFSILIIVLNIKIQKKRKKTKIVLSTVSIILSILFLVMFVYLSKTSGFLNNIMSKDYKTQNYIVVVNKDSSYSKVEDIKDKTISYVENDAHDITLALTELEKKVSLKNKKEDNYETLLQNLYDNKVDAILLEESYKDLLVNSATEGNNESAYYSFSNKTKIIYTFEIKVNETEQIKDVNVDQEPFNIYISGIDTYGKISSVSRSDVNIVVTVNPKTKQVLLTTIPRDFYVQLNGTTGVKDKLTHAGIYGVNKSVATIEDLLDIDINYYIKVNFTSLVKIVDALGGVNVYSKYSFTGYNGSTFKKGYSKMNGEKALEFARTRKTVQGGDKTRGENQEAVIAAIIKKACSKSIIFNYTSILDSLSDSFTTNVGQEKIKSLVKMQLNDMASWNVTSISLNGTDSYNYTHSYGNTKLYVMVPIESSIINAQEKIQKVFDGELLDSSYIEESNETNV